MAELEVNRLKKAYDGHLVVNDVSFCLPSGKLLTLLGPSGCGKSTTLRIIAGLTSSDSGSIRLARRDVTSLRPADRNIGMVFQSLALFPHMTVAENIDFGLRVQRVPKSERNERIRAVLDLTRMQPYADRFPSQISGGQRQRVALARAIVFNPDVLLLDEPFSALDRKLRDEMQHELRLLVNKIGITTVFVTHDQEEAMRVSDYVAVMHNGSIDQFDSPDVVYNRPATSFVADFMGATNFVTGTVKNVSDRVANVVVHGTEFEVPLPSTARPDFGSVVKISIRPERLRLTSDRPVKGPSMKAIIENRIFEGAFTAYDIKLEGSSTCWTVRQAGKNGDDDHIEGSAWVTWNREDVNLLGKSS